MDPLGFTVIALMLLKLQVGGGTMCSVQMEGARKSLSVSLKPKPNRIQFLMDMFFETLNLTIWEECYSVCVRKCQCLFFNFNEVNKTENCELSDANTKLAPEALQERKEVTCYKIGSIIMTAK